MIRSVKEAQRMAKKAHLPIPAGVQFEMASKRSLGAWGKRTNAGYGHRWWKRNGKIIRKEPRIILHRSVGIETLAHELGHAHHKHRRAKTYDQLIKGELQAWKWAQENLGRKLRTHYPLEVGDMAIDEFGATPKQVIASLKRNAVKVGANKAKISRVPWKTYYEPHFKDTYRDMYEKKRC